MQTTIFSDGLANIRMVDGVLRFELINITAQPAPDKLDVQAVGSVAMTLQGLVRTYNQLSGVMNQLTQQGLLKRSEPGEAQPQATAPAIAAPAVAAPVVAAPVAAPAAIPQAVPSTLKKMAK